MPYHFHRPLVKQLERFLEPEQNLMVMLVGARRTGKTTAIMQVSEIMKRRNCCTVYKSFDEPHDPSRQQPFDPVSLDQPHRLRQQKDLRNAWEQARQQARKNRCPALLAFDEIQNVPEWPGLVKGLWDQDQRQENSIKVIITGSAPLLLAKGAADKLLGRHLSVTCPHWSFSEMKEVFSFDLKQYLFFGGYPLSGGEYGYADEDDPGDRDEKWRRFVNSMLNSYLLKDLLATVPDIRNKGGLLRLLPAVLQYAGRQVSYSKLGRLVPEISNTTTLARYLDYFGQMQLVTGLQGYSATPHGKRTIPKIVVHNNALVVAGSGYSFLAARADRTFWGRLVENAVGAHLLQTLDTRARLHYWRKDSHEVDYVVEQDGRRFAIEVKSSLTGNRPPGLERFAQQYSRAVVRKVPSPDMPLERFLGQAAAQTIEQWQSEDS